MDGIYHGNLSLHGDFLAERDGGWFCHYCFCPIHPRPNSVPRPHQLKQATIDHKIPLSKGGRHRRSNMVLACRKCNAEKSDMPYSKYLKLRRGRVNPA